MCVCVFGSGTGAQWSLTVSAALFLCERVLRACLCVCVFLCVYLREAEFEPQTLEMKTVLQSEDISAIISFFQGVN